MDPEIVEQLKQMGIAFDAFIATNETKVKGLEATLAAEKKEREALELKLGRMNLSGGGNNLGLPAGIDAAQLAVEHKAMDAFVRSEVRDWANCAEVKAMSVGSDPDGGYVVMPVRSQAMVTRLYNESPIRRLARVETMETGDAWEEVVDLDEAASSWVGEAETRPTTATPRIGLLRVPLCEVYANPKVTQKQLDTAYLNVGQWLDNKIADKFARGDGLAFVSGNSPSRPRGFLTLTNTTETDFNRAYGKLQYTASGAAATLGTTDPASSDNLRKVMWSLRAPYRRDAVWLMNSNTASVIDRLKDGQNNYLWRPGQTAGAPASLLGYPVEIDENMDDIGANANPVAFGNFKLGYLIVERPGMKLLQDPFTDKPNVLFYATRRVGGDVANSDCIKLLKCAVS